MDSAWPLLIGVALAVAVVRVARRIARSKSSGGSPAAATGSSPERAVQPLGGEPASSTHVSHRETDLATRIVQLAESVFPEDAGLKWAIQGFDHRERLTLVEVEPQGGWVGYPRFKFAVSFEGIEPNVIATYCFERGRFVLLSSIRGPGEALPRVL
jgi:hypothetical protein